MQHLSWVGNDGFEDLSGGRREDNRDYSILDVVNQIFEVFFGELNVVNNLPVIVVLQRDSPCVGSQKHKREDPRIWIIGPAWVLLYHYTACFLRELTNYRHRNVSDISVFHVF